MSEKKRDSERTIGAYIGAIIANGIVLVLINLVPGWNLRFITDAYQAALWAMNVSVLVQIGGNFALIFFHPRFFHHLANAVFNGFSLFATIVLLTVFPFDFSYFTGDWGNRIVRIVLIIAIVGASIGILTHLFKAIGGIFAFGREPDSDR